MTGTERLRDAAAAMRCALKEGEPLCAYTTFHIGGPAELMLFPADGDMMHSLLCFCREWEIPFFVLGKGSNLLIADEGISGAVICTDRMRACDRSSDTQIHCEAGVPLVKLCKTAAEAGLSGLEFAYGIPGSAGGAVYMNAGAYGGEMRDVLEQVTACNAHGKLFSLNAGELELGYRSSVFQSKEWYILSLVVTLKPESSQQITEKMESYLARRKDKQPLQYPSAGSVFKRPEGYYAGALIEQCGLKGFMIGGAQVSEKHAGFIVNRGGASAQDVLRLIDHIRNTVLKETGVLLEPEIRYIV